MGKTAAIDETEPADTSRLGVVQPAPSQAKQAPAAPLSGPPSS